MPGNLIRRTPNIPDENSRRANQTSIAVEANDLGHCAVYEKELQRVWPITEENRKAKIAEFAKEHGFQLVYYKQGLCAIFVENSTGRDIRARENLGPSEGL